jgi:hypothetical protein
LKNEVLQRAARLPIALVLLLGAGCAMRSSSPEPAESGASGQATSVSAGSDMPRAEREVDDAPATESTYGGAVPSEAPPRAPTAPGTSPAPVSQDVPQSTTVETVVVGRSTSDSVRTVGGNATAGSAWARLVDTEDTLHDALGLASVDCDAARDLRDRICDLGERICSIAGDHPDDHVTEDRCEDGRDRCERARRRVDDRCD